MNKTVMQNEDKLHGLDVAANRLGVSIWTLRQKVQHGDVASHKLFGRRLIAESEIQRLLEQSRVPARAEAA